VSACDPKVGRNPAVEKHWSKSVTHSLQHSDYSASTYFVISEDGALAWKPSVKIKDRKEK